MEPVDRDELAAEAYAWAGLRLASFPLWSYEDIWTQAYLEAHAIWPLYDSQRGSLARFLKLRLYERVRVAYLVDIGFMPVRRFINGKWQKRTAMRMTYPLQEADLLFSDSEEMAEMPKLRPQDQRTADLMRWGMTQKQVASLEGLTESAISQRVRRIRKKIAECNRH